MQREKAASVNGPECALASSQPLTHTLPALLLGMDRSPTNEPLLLLPFVAAYVFPATSATRRTRSTAQTCPLAPSSRHRSSTLVSALPLRPSLLPLLVPFPRLPRSPEPSCPELFTDVCATSSIPNDLYTAGMFRKNNADVRYGYSPHYRRFALLFIGASKFSARGLLF